MTNQDSDKEETTKKKSCVNKIILVAVLTVFFSVIAGHLAWRQHGVRLFVCDTVIYLFSTNEFCFDIRTPLHRVDWGGFIGTKAAEGK
ncbi:MAG: hypothetical protein K8S14_02785 [Actinomycetia bacterium]|nr:hypothetical protein [Actinomycetes bacterium]